MFSCPSTCPRGLSLRIPVVGWIEEKKAVGMSYYCASTVGCLLPLLLPSYLS